MDLGHGKKRPLPGGETSESKRSFSRRGSSGVDADSVKTDVSGYVSTEQRSAQFSHPPPHDGDGVLNWWDDLCTGVDSEAYAIGNAVKGNYSSAEKPSSCTSFSGAFRSCTTGDSASQLGQLQPKDDRFVGFEQHRSCARSRSNRKSEVCGSEHDALAKSTNGFLILHHGSIEGSGISHARHIKTQWNRFSNYGQVLDSSKEEELGSPLGKSHHRKPIWNIKDQSFRGGDAFHQSDSDSQIKETKALHRSTFAIFLGKIVSDCSDTFSADEKARFRISVDQRRLAAHRVILHRKSPHSEGVSTSLDGLQQPEPVNTRDVSPGELQNERQFTAYVNSSGRLMLKEGAREPTIDHEFEERFSALLLS